MICAYIDAYRSRFGVEPICAVLTEHGITIAPSTYYARHKTPVTVAEWDQAHLVNRLVDLHRQNWGVYGQRKLLHAARRAGLEVGRDQVGRLMGIAGVKGAVRGHHKTVTTHRDTSAPRHPDLVKRGWHIPTAPDQLWVADFSYVWTSLPSCPIPEVARLGRTLKQSKTAFLAYFNTGRANNGGSEAINGLIELHRRIARGFRNPDNYRLRMLLIAGGLTPTHPPQG